MQQIRQMIADVDKDGSGAIDYEEFEHMMTAKIGERDSKEELSKAFRIIDQDGNVKHHPSFLWHMLSYMIVLDYHFACLIFSSMSIVNLLLDNKQLDFLCSQQSPKWFS
jgi:hypothetical protein